MKTLFLRNLNMARRFVLLGFVQFEFHYIGIILDFKVKFKQNSILKDFI